MVQNRAFRESISGGCYGVTHTVNEMGDVVSSRLLVAQLEFASPAECVSIVFVLVNSARSSSITRHHPTSSGCSSRGSSSGSSGSSSKACNGFTHQTSKLQSRLAGVIKCNECYN
jgi:hypothetical protein